MPGPAGPGADDRARRQLDDDQPASPTASRPAGPAAGPPGAREHLAGPRGRGPRCASRAPPPDASARRPAPLRPDSPAATRAICQETHVPAVRSHAPPGPARPRSRSAPPPVVTASPSRPSTLDGAGRRRRRPRPGCSWALRDAESADGTSGSGACPSAGCSDPAFAVRVTTPPGAAARVAVASADAELTGRFGDLDLSSASGDLDRARQRRALRRPLSGDTRIGRSTAFGRVRRRATSAAGRSGELQVRHSPRGRLGGADRRGPHDQHGLQTRPSPPGAARADQAVSGDASVGVVRPHLAEPAPASGRMDSQLRRAAGDGRRLARTMRSAPATRPPARPGRLLARGRAAAAAGGRRQVAAVGTSTSSSSSQSAMSRSSSASAAATSGRSMPSSPCAAWTRSTPAWRSALRSTRRDQLVAEQERQHVVAVHPLRRPACRSPAGTGSRRSAPPAAAPRRASRTGSAAPAPGPTGAGAPPGPARPARPSRRPRPAAAPRRRPARRSAVRAAAGRSRK